MRPVFVGLSVLLAPTMLCIGVAHAELPFRLDATPGKLPKSVLPLAYALALKPDIEARRFTGHETIDIDVRTPVSVVTLNATDLEIGRVALEQGDPAQVTPAQVTLDPKAQTASFRFPHPLGVGRHRLVLDYAGPITAQPAGLYYNDYTTPTGRKRMLVTQFEVSDARRMLPCWDELVFKATFAISLTLPDKLAAISNMPIEASMPAGGGLKTVRFATTPRMSSYLLDLDAGELQAVRGHAGRTDIAVWTVAGKQEQGRYALQAEASILTYYNEYFGVPYPLPKLDMVAVPGNYAAGAMENWGAITYIDNDLLYDPANSGLLTREEVYLTVAHEMAHQWSGDLVTMAWWNNIWLNEGFATWMEDKATDHFNPAWHIWERSHAETERAMAIDALSSTHPIQQPIADESEADSAFDEISYQKGEAFIRMIEGWLGEDVFRDGMRRYMKAHAYSSSTTADLWSALTAASGKPVASVAAGFTEQPGIPLIQASSRCVGGRSVLTLRQDRFTLHDPKAARLSWQVPVRVGEAGSRQEQRVLVSRPAPAQVSLPGCTAPIVANLDASGYYRVQYDPGLLRRLDQGFATLPGADRAELLADQWGLFAAGRDTLPHYMTLLRQLGGETDLAVWDEAITRLAVIDNLTRGSAARAPFRAWARGLLAPVAARLGWDARPGEDTLDTLLRGEVLAALGRFDDAAVVAEAQRRFDRFLIQPASLPSVLRGTVAEIVGRHADQPHFDALRRLGRSASGSEEKLRYYYALAGARDPKLIAQTVAITSTGEVSNGRLLLFLIHAAQQSDDPRRVWKDVADRQAQIRPLLVGEQADRLLPDVADASADPALAHALMANPAAGTTTGARTQVRRAVAGIETASDLRTRLLPPLQAWLSAPPPAASQ